MTENGKQPIAMIDNNTVKKDDLLEIVCNAECLDQILADVLTDCFEGHSPERGMLELQLLAHDYKRYRYYANICFDLAHKIMTGLHSAGVYCYGEGAAKA